LKRKKNDLFYRVIFTVVLLSFVKTTVGFAAMQSGNPGNNMPSDSIILNKPDTIDLHFDFSDENGMYFFQQQESPLFLKRPANVTTSIEYDPITGQYIFKDKVGSFDYRRPSAMTFNQYQEYANESLLRNYWLERSQAASLRSSEGAMPQIEIGGEAFERIFGGNTIDIRPQGTARIDFGVVSNKREDPSLDVRRRRTTNFNFDEEIAMNVMAKIGDKIEFQTNYNTEATFDFENKLKLKYEGKEDEILKLIEAGDVNLPLNSTLISGSQSLFGIKTKLKFGRATVTAVFSQQKSETKNITVQGGAQTNRFQLKADEYEENRHFFLAHFFRENYEEALSELPIIKSNIEINKIEVWRTTIGPATENNRNIIAFADLGETDRFNNPSIAPVAGAYFPSNDANTLMIELDTTQLRDINTVSDYLETHPYGFTPGRDFEKIENATKLDPSQYSVNSRLGFISLNTTLNPDQVLAIAIQYKVIGQDRVYQIGEFSDEGISSPNALIVKLLKSTSVNTNIPIWDLMMKNVYALGAYQINREDFMLNILYSGNASGVPTGYLNEGPPAVNGVPLIQVLNLDNLDQQNNPPSDGVFDFIDNAATNGGTMQSSNGRFYFPVLEPFGSYLRTKLQDEELGNKYAYDSLYTMTKVGAQQYPNKNKFIIEGMYKSSSGSEISLNALNVPRGSVQVSAGGVPLTENVDYTVDYTLGRVRIINEGILSSGTPINITTESQSMFNVQQQRMMGAHVDYMVDENFNLGATIINLHETPLTQKTNIGDEPISNTIWGLNMDYQRDSRLLTKLIDKLPFIETKAKSSVQFNGEFAHFIPGHSKAVGKKGTSYIDDFEGSKSAIDLKYIGSWNLASTPQGQYEAGMFPEAAAGTGLAYGYNRARLAWYIIDPLFYEQTGNLRPGNIDNDELSSHYVRFVSEKEVFPNVDPPNNNYMNLPILNLVYYPDEKGPYNYDVNGQPGYSQGMNEEGKLEVPESRWGGIMRKIESTDFEATNVEYIEFWMMDPFVDPDGDGPKEPMNKQGGKLYFNLGDISEDILKDRRKSFEHGLPTSELVQNVDTTIWGRVPAIQALVNEFDNNDASRPFQDVGYDGLRNEDEQTFFDSTYLQHIAAQYGPTSEAYIQALADPSGDDYHYFRGSDYDDNPLYSSILERYKKYNGPDGNSPSDAMNPEPYSTVATRNPDVEDINVDNTLSESERYYQYVINLDPNNMQVGQNYIADKYTPIVNLANGKQDSVTWYQFKVPVRYPDKVVGDIQDFNSIRFMRLFMKDFKEPVVLRFATLELVRGEWRTYEQALLEDGEYIVQEDESTFEIAAVNIEENGKRDPIPYVLPPGIEREMNIGTTNLTQLNEQSMVLEVCGLDDGFARAAYKTTDFDFRRYKKLEMFIHAEKTRIEDNYETGDLTAFIRLGSDFNQNYYEYEVPLEFTQWGTYSKEEIWPEANQISLDLQKLVNAKLERQDAINVGNSNLTSNMTFVTYDGKNKITVKGVPNLGDVKTIMVGVRNPKKTSLEDIDDGQSKCAEIWMNELRLTNFDEKSGWAATGRLKANLADLGSVVVAGSHSTPGFGGIAQTIDERQKEKASQFDVATNLQLGKFLPEESGVKIPMHFDYSESRLTPEYDPMEPDVKLDQKLDKLSKSDRDSLLKVSQDLTVRKNINFMNVRKERVGAKAKNPKIWDIENFNFSYSYSEIFHRNIDIEYDLTKQYQGGFGYNFSIKPKTVIPFKNVGFLDGSYLRLIKDFNFNYLPRMFSFQTNMNRRYNERLLRSKSIGDVKLEPTYLKNWDWNRNYSLQYDLTKSIKLDYTANANAYIDEPPGEIDRNADNYRDIRDTIMQEIYGLGSINKFNHVFNASYDVPLNKIPLFDFTSIQARYSANYTWQASPESVQARLGNSIENSNNIQVNGSFRLSKLYSKVGYIKKMEQESRKKANQRRSRMNPRRPQPKQQDDSTKNGANIPKLILDNTIRILTGIKDVSVNYTETNGTRLPGFTPEPDLLGNYLGSTMAPGLGFVFGSQEDIRFKAAQNGWLTSDTLLNNPYMLKSNDNLSYRLQFEPFKDFKIELTGNRTRSENHTEYFRADADGIFQSYNPVQSGSFSSSIITWKTAFEPFNDDNVSAAYDQMKENRQIIARRLADVNPWSQGMVDSTGYPDGYSAASQQVILPAFLAAYTGSSAESIQTSPFINFPLPNWRITFNGLTNIPFVKKYIKSLAISHSYRSSYTVGQYVSNVNYQEQAGAAYARNQANDFYPKNEIGLVTISEQLSPLIGFDATLHNSLMARFEIKKSRNLSLSFTNNQMTEVKSNEIVIGTGYRIKDIAFFIKSMAGGKNSSRTRSDLNIKLDLSIKDNKTILRRIDEDVAQISAGRKMFTLNATADYNVNQKFNLRFYFNTNVNSPYISTQFPTSNTEGGISMTFSL
jgi:cell surface protein SprA